MPAFIPLLISISRALHARNKNIIISAKSHIAVIKHSVEESVIYLTVICIFLQEICLRLLPPVCLSDTQCTSYNDPVITMHQLHQQHPQPQWLNNATNGWTTDSSILLTASAPLVHILPMLMHYFYQRIWATLPGHQTSDAVTDASPP